MFEVNFLIKKPENSPIYNELVFKYNHRLTFNVGSISQEYLEEVYHGSPDGPMIANLMMLAEVSMEKFGRFCEYVKDIACDLVNDLSAGERVIGSTKYTGNMISTLLVIAEALDSVYLATAQGKVIEMDTIEDHVSVLIFDVMTKWCVCTDPKKSRSVIDEYNLLYSWFSVCGIPVIRESRMTISTVH